MTVVAMFGKDNESAQLRSNVPQKACVGSEQLDIALVARVKENGGRALCGVRIVD